VKTKQERCDLEKKGINILRSQFNQHKQKWQIVRHTNKQGGWEVFKNDLFESETAADEIIDWYQRQYPEKYIKD
jgi:hypothetical protein